MSLLNNNFLTFGGEPVAGRVPTQIIVKPSPDTGETAELTPELYSAVCHAYKLFCDAVRVSPHANMFHVQNRQFPDASKARFESNAGVHRVMVWPTGGGQSDVLGRLRPVAWFASSSSPLGDSKGAVWTNPPYEDEDEDEDEAKLIEIKDGIVELYAPDDLNNSIPGNMESRGEQWFSLSWWAMVNGRYNARRPFAEWDNEALNAAKGVGFGWFSGDEKVGGPPVSIFRHIWLNGVHIADIPAGEAVMGAMIATRYLEDAEEYVYVIRALTCGIDASNPYNYTPFNTGETLKLYEIRYSGEIPHLIRTKPVIITADDLLWEKPNFLTSFYSPAFFSASGEKMVITNGDGLAGYRCDCLEITLEGAVSVPAALSPYIVPLVEHEIGSEIVTKEEHPLSSFAEKVVKDRIIEEIDTMTDQVSILAADYIGDNLYLIYSKHSNHRERSVEESYPDATLDLWDPLYYTSVPGESYTLEYTEEFSRSSSGSYYEKFQVVGALISSVDNTFTEQIYHEWEHSYSYSTEQTGEIHFRENSVLTPVGHGYTYVAVAEKTLSTTGEASMEGDTWIISPERVAVIGDLRNGFFHIVIDTYEESLQAVMEEERVYYKRTLTGTGAYLPIGTGVWTCGSQAHEVEYSQPLRAGINTVQIASRQFVYTTLGPAPAVLSKVSTIFNIALPTDPLEFKGTFSSTNNIGPVVGNNIGHLNLFKPITSITSNSEIFSALPFQHRLVVGSLGKWHPGGHYQINHQHYTDTDIDTDTSETSDGREVEVVTINVTHKPNWGTSLISIGWGYPNILVGLCATSYDGTLYSEAVCFNTGPSPSDDWQTKSPTIEDWQSRVYNLYTNEYKDLNSEDEFCTGLLMTGPVLGAPRSKLKVGYRKDFMTPIKDIIEWANK